MAESIAVVMKGGSYELDTQIDNISVKFTPNSDMLHTLAQIVDVYNAEASVPSDRVRIIKEIEASPGGIDALNSTVRGILSGSELCSNNPLVLAAACGDKHAIKELESKPNFIVEAAAGGHLTLLKHLIDKGADVNFEADLKPYFTVHYREKKLHTALMAAARGGHLECCQALLQVGAKVNARDKDKVTALHYATSYGHDKVVQILLSAGASVPKRGHSSKRRNDYDSDSDAEMEELEGCDILHQSAEGNYVKCVQLLLDAGVDPCLGYSVGSGQLYTAIHAAVSRNAIDCVQLLIPLTDFMKCREAFMHVMNDANLDCVKLMAPQFPNHLNDFLVFALMMSHLECARVLLSLGACIPVDSHSNLLQRMEHENNQKSYGCLELLVEAGVDITSNTHNNKDGKPLFMTFSPHCLPLFIKAGADVNERDKRGRNFLMNLADSSTDKSDLTLLFENEVDILAQDYDGMSALMLACVKGNTSIVHSLMSRGREQLFKTLDFSGKNALLHSVIANQLDCIQVLIEGAIDVNLPCEKGLTAVMYAVRNNCVAAFPLLLEGGCDVLAMDKSGMTAVMHAVECEHDNIAMLKLLVKAGGDVKSKSDFTGMSPILIAAKTGHKKCLEALLEMGCDANEKCSAGISVLMYAALSGVYTPALIDAGAKLDYVSNDSLTVFMHAAGGRNMDWISAVTQSPAREAERVCKHGRNALMYFFCMKDWSPPVTSYIRSDQPKDYSKEFILLARATDLKHRCNDGMSVYMYAMKSAFVVELFSRIFNTEQGFEDEIMLQKCPRERNIIHYAAEYGNSFFLAWLKECKFQPIAGASLGRYTSPNRLREITDKEESLVENLFVRDSSGSFPAHLAASSGNSSLCLKIFIDAGTDIDSRDGSGATLFILACRGGNLKGAHYLLEKSLLDITAVDNSNETGTAYLMKQLADMKLRDQLPSRKKQITEDWVAVVWYLLLAVSKVSEVLFIQTLNDLISVGYDIVVITEPGAYTKQFNCLTIASEKKYFEALKFLVGLGFQSQSLISCLKSIISTGNAECVVDIINHLKGTADFLQKVKNDALVTSASSGEVHCLKALLDMGALPINPTRDDYKGSALLAAATSGSKECIELLIAAGADIHENEHDPDAVIDTSVRMDCTALLMAVYKGHTECVEVLLNAGANMARSAEPYHQQSLLSVAVDREVQAECIRVLLKHGAVPDTSLLKQVVATGKADSLQLLLSQGATIFSDKSQHSEELLVLIRQSITSGDICSKCLKVLLDLISLESCIDSNVEKETPLVHLAAQHCNLNALKLLVDKGLDSQAVTGAGMTLLMTYALKGDTDGISFALEISNDPSVQLKRTCKNGCTPLMYAVTSGSVECVRLVLEIVRATFSDTSREIINAKDSTGKSALAIAAGLTGTCENSPHSRCASLLVEVGADVSSISLNGKTILMYLAIAGQFFYAKSLIRFDKNMDLDAQDCANMSALSHAAVNGHNQMVNTLYEAYMNENQNKGIKKKHDENVALPEKSIANIRFAMISAAKTRHLKCLQELMKFDVDVNGVDKFKMSPFVAACEAGQPKCIAFLLESGADFNAVDSSGKQGIDYVITNLISSGVTSDNDQKLDCLKIIYVEVCSRGYEEHLTRLLGTNIPGIDVLTLMDDDKRNGLMLSMRGGHENCAKILLAAGMSIHHQDIDGQVALSYCIKSGNVELLEVLIAAGANVLYEESKSNRSVGQYSIDQNQKECFKLLLQHGILDFEVKGCVFGLAMAALWAPDDEFFNLLVEKGGKSVINSTNVKNEPLLLLCSVCSKSEKMIRRMLQHGADAGVRDAEGKTVAHHILMYGFDEDNLTVLKILCEAGLDVNAVDSFGRTPLHDIAEAKTPVEKLMSFSFNIFIPDKKNMTPLRIMISEVLKHTRHINLYLPICKGFIQLAPTEKLQGTSLVEVHSIIENIALTTPAGVPIMGMLIEHFSINIGDIKLSDEKSKGSNLLIEVCKRGYCDLIQMSLNNGANSSFVDKNGMTAIDHVMGLKNEATLHRCVWIFLSFASKSPENVSLMSLLKKAKVDLNTSEKSTGFTALFIACEEENDVAVKFLIESGCDVNYKNDMDSTPIFYVANKACLQLLLDAGADVEHTNSAGEQPLSTLIVHKNGSEMISTLVAAGVDINTKNADGMTVLMQIAKKSDSPEAISLLLAAGADLGAQNDKGHTAILLACHSGHVLNLQALLQTNLHRAGHVGNVNAIIEIKSAVNLCDRKGGSPLMYAINTNNYDCVQPLIDAGADVNLAGKDGKTALMYAVKAEQLSVVSRLLEAKCDVSHCDLDGRTALIHVAKSVNDCSEILKLLVEAGADVNAKATRSSTSPLQCAIKAGNGANFHTLVTLGADISDCGNMLEIACKKGNVSILKRLLEVCNIQFAENGITLLKKCISADSIDCFRTILPSVKKETLQSQVGYKLLHDIILRGKKSASIYLRALVDAGVSVKNPEGKDTTVCDAIKSYSPNHLYNKTAIDNFVLTLLELGADMNAVSSSGETALMNACKRGHVDVVEALIERDCDVNATDDQQRTALFYVKSSADLILPILHAAGADLDARDNEGMTALMTLNSTDTMNLYACEVQHALINQGADINLKCSKLGRTGLMYAAINGTTKNVLVFGKNRADREAVCNAKKTALNYLEERNDASLLEFYQSMCQQKQSLLDHMRYTGV